MHLISTSTSRSALHCTISLKENRARRVFPVATLALSLSLSPSFPLGCMLVDAGLFSLMTLHYSATVQLRAASLACRICASAWAFLDGSFVGDRGCGRPRYPRPRVPASIQSRQQQLGETPHLPRTRSSSNGFEALGLKARRAAGRPGARRGSVLSLCSGYAVCYTLVRAGVAAECG